MKILLFEPQGIQRFYPLARLRPLCDLRFGALTLRRKVQERFPESEVHLEVRPELHAVASDAYGTGAVNHPDGLEPDDDLLLVSAAAVLSGPAELTTDRERAVASPGGEFVWAFLSAASLARLGAASGRELARAAVESLPTSPAEGALIAAPGDLLRLNAAEIRADFELAYYARPSAPPPPEAAVRGDPALLWISEDAALEPCTFLDCRDGPVIIESGAVLHAHTTVVGPACLGEGSHLLSGRIGPGVTLGPHCRAEGALAHCIVQGGLRTTGPVRLEHACVGWWAETGPWVAAGGLGAPAELAADGRDREAAAPCTVIGDYARIGADSVFASGLTVGVVAEVGPGSHVGAGAVQAFHAWRDGMSEPIEDLAAAVERCRAAMARAGAELTEAQVALITAAHGGGRAPARDA